MSRRRPKVRIATVKAWIAILSVRGVEDVILKCDPLRLVSLSYDLVCTKLMAEQRTSLAGLALRENAVEAD